MKRDLISIKDLEVEEIEAIFGLAKKLKNHRKDFGQPLKNKILALVFEKPSNRTRVSFEVGMIELGGSAIYIGPGEIQPGKREEIRDVARVMSRYLDGVVARVFKHEDLIELSRYSSIPIINGLSNLEHPCQALSDLFTISEKRKLKGLTLAFIGDGNNVANSLLYGCSKLGINFKIASPNGYEIDKEVAKNTIEFAKKSNSKIEILNRPEEAARGADIIYTDVWVSMGQERERKERLKAFKLFQVNSNLLKFAKPDCLIMHCLPAHRGEEITDEVLEGPHSIVFDQAENRLHVQKGILIELLI